MDIKEALQLVDRVLANVSGTRADHATVQQALQVIQKTLDDQARIIQELAKRGPKDKSESGKAIS